MKWSPLLLLTLLPTSVSAMSNSDFEAKAEQLKKSQDKTEQFLSRLQPKVSSTSKGDSEKVSPLITIHGSLSHSWIPSGKVLNGKLLNRLIVSSEGAPALIQLDNEQGDLSGARLMGLARAGSAPGRVTLELSKILLSSGRAIPCLAVGLDQEGAYGVSAEVISGKAIAVVGAMASSFIAGLAASQQSQTANAFGIYQPQTTGRNAVLQGVAQTAADQSRRFIEDSTSEKPVLVVEPNVPVAVLVQEEMKY
ncbi:TrbI/VirB10 family protein [bacterium]|nr:TrbI/VirB10 family protein [bacterium]